MTVAISVWFMVFWFKHWILWLIVGSFIGTRFIDRADGGNPLLIRIFCGMFLVVLLFYIPPAILVVLSFFIPAMQ